MPKIIIATAILVLAFDILSYWRDARLKNTRMKMKGNIVPDATSNGTSVFSFFTSFFYYWKHIKISTLIKEILCIFLAVLLALETAHYYDQKEHIDHVNGTIKFINTDLGTQMEVLEKYMDEYRNNEATLEEVQAYMCLDMTRILDLLYDEDVIAAIPELLYTLIIGHCRMVETIYNYIQSCSPDEVMGLFDQAYVCLEFAIEEMDIYYRRYIKKTISDKYTMDWYTGHIGDMMANGVMWMVGPVG